VATAPPAVTNPDAATLATYTAEIKATVTLVALSEDNFGRSEVQVSIKTAFASSFGVAPDQVSIGSATFTTRRRLAASAAVETTVIVPPAEQTTVSARISGTTAAVIESTLAQALAENGVTDAPSITASPPVINLGAAPTAAPTSPTPASRQAKPAPTGPEKKKCAVAFLCDTFEDANLPIYVVAVAVLLVGCCCCCCCEWQRQRGRRTKKEAGTKRAPPPPRKGDQRQAIGNQAADVVEMFDQNQQRKYYWNKQTGRTGWSKPEVQQARVRGWSAFDSGNGSPLAFQHRDNEMAQSRGKDQVV
jgi:hypothetical protein